MRSSILLTTTASERGRAARWTVNLLLPGAATVTGMLPPTPCPGATGSWSPAVMGPPIVWLASDDAAGVHDERIVAAEFDRWLRDRTGRR